MKKITFLLFSSCAAQEKNNQSRSKQQGKYDTNKFSQMYDLLATPNMFRNAAEHQDLITSSKQIIKLILN
jgi:hypothetical protein